MSTHTEDPQDRRQWAIIEVIGGDVLAGEVLTAGERGARLLEVRVPETPDCGAFVRAFPLAGVHSITTVTEAEAFNAAVKIGAVVYPPLLLVLTEDPHAPANVGAEFPF